MPSPDAAPVGIGITVLEQSRVQHLQVDMSEFVVKNFAACLRCSVVETELLMRCSGDWLAATVVTTIADTWALVDYGLVVETLSSSSAKPMRFCK